MEKILETITLSAVLGVFLFLASIWLIKIIAKKEKRSLFQGMSFFLFILLVFFFVNKQDQGHLSLIELRNHYFPTKTLKLNYRINHQGSGLSAFSVYTFDEPRPPLNVSLDNTGKYSHITNPRSVNRILKEIGLPLVETGVPELASITGSHFDRFKYRWENYPLGVLTLVKTRCQNRDTVNWYECVIKISISSGR